MVILLCSIKQELNIIELEFSFWLLPKFQGFLLLKENKYTLHVEYRDSGVSQELLGRPL